MPLAALYSPFVTLEADQQRLVFTPEALGIKIDYDETVRQAFALTHDESYLAQLRERLAKGPIRAPLILTADEGQLKNVIESLAGELAATPQDASILLREENGGYHIEPEILGREVEIQKTIESIKAALKEGKRILPVAVKLLAPRVTEKLLRAFPPAHRLAAYTTYYGRHDSPNRIHNIKLIASWIDGTLLLSGETFSLAEKIGPFTPERGFKEAFVIYGGVLVPQLGGGTCQIGTTLYNAAALADLNIIERSNHSFYFNIYPLGRDATVYPGQKDLKFQNNTNHPVLLKAVATNRRLSFRVYGTPTGKTAKFSNPAVFLLEGGRYRPATVKEVLEADAPFKTTVVRTVFNQAGQKLAEYVSNSYYKLYGEKTNVPIERPEPR